MKKQNIFKSAQRGSLMVEALALLGLITMVTPVMYKKAAERTTELQDINVATQMRTLNEALDNYVRNNFKDMEDKVPANQKIVVNAKSGGDIVEGIKAYLPAGFDISQSRYFDAENLQFAIQRTVTKDLNEKERSVYTTSVLAPSLKDLKLNRASKIASMVGVNGGIVKKGKDEDKQVVEGTQGAWGVDDIKDWFPGVGDLKIGSLMTISNEAVAEAAQADTSKLLYRVDDGDESKNTMMTNLLMDNVGIEGLTHLLGHGDKLYIGGNGEGGTQETNLIVKGTTEIAKALTVKTGGITVEEGGLNVKEGGAEITGDSTFHGAVNIDENLSVKGNTDLTGTLNVNDATTLNSTLDVKGATTLGNTLEVKGDTTLKENLSVEGNTALAGTLDVAGVTNLNNDLNVTGTTNLKDTNVDGDLTITGTLDAENLHARSQLTVGGDASGAGDIMYVASDSFSVTQGNNAFYMDNNDISLSAGDNLVYLDDDKFEVDVSNGTVLKMQDGDAALSANGTKLNLTPGKATMSLPNSASTIQLGGDTNTSASINVAGGAAKFDLKYTGTGGGSIKAVVKNNEVIDINERKSTISSYYLGRGNYASVELDGNGFNISRKNNGTRLSGISMNSEDEFNVNSKNMYVDDNGMALGYNLTASGGDRTVTSEDLSGGNGQQVIISRKGYIEIAPPEGTDGNNAGYIKARRLVSDVKYKTFKTMEQSNERKGDNYFHGTYNEDQKYQYYEVNPAYTSVMNDIKLASRGGARLSDILSDYVIKGIYVADNTYQDNGLKWEYIPIDRGSPEEGVIKEGVGPDASSDKAQTVCSEMGKCTTIEVCRTADCVASPWLGYVPRPICPPGYQAVITSYPIRWRMSEVYYLSDAAKGWERKGESNFGVDEDGNTIDKGIYSKIITDSDNTIGFVSDEDDGRNWAHSFKYNFHRQNDPLKAYFNLGTETSVSNDDGEDKHTHEASAKPLTVQTNTWLNSSVYPYLEGGEVLGWHVLMGFIYRPSDYEQLLKDINVEVEAEDIVWNIFPVYAQEMASIATTYCAFVRNPEGNGNWRWGSNESGSPVLEYDQLNRTSYRDPIVGEKNDDWIDNVNDPSLPYYDAW